MSRGPLLAPDRNARAGFMLAPLLYMLALAGIGAAVMFSGYSQVLRSNAEMTAINTVRQQLQSAGQTLSATSVLDTPTSSIVQPPALTTFASVTDTARLPTGYAATGSTGTPLDVGVVSISSGVRQLDPWGKYYIYCRWEDPVATPASPAFMVISAGPDGELETKCGDAAAVGDDRMTKLTVAEAINRANTWQVTSDTQVKFGIETDAVKVNQDGSMNAKSITLSGSGTVITATGNISVGNITGGTLATGASTLASAAVTGNETVGGTLGVTGATTLAGLTAGATTLGTLSAAASTLASAAVTGAATVGGTLGVTGATTLAGLTAGATALGATTLASGAITGNATVGGTLGVTGATTLSSTLSAGATTLASSAVTGNETVGGTLGLTGNFAINTNKFTVAAASGNTVVAGSLTVSGQFNASNVNITGGSISGVDLTGSTGGTAGSVAAGNVTGCCVAVASGGTGSGTAAGARTNLGADDATNLTTGTLDWNRLLNSGVVAATYSWGTVNSKGIVTAANDVATSAISQGDTSVAATDSGSNGTITFTTDGTQRMVIDNNGNVGIGTATPGQKLDVNGNIRIQKAAGNDRTLFFGSGASNRWAVTANSTAEAGSNAGSDFVITKYADNGTTATNVFSITRSTGAASFAGDLSAGGTIVSTGGFIGDGSGLTNVTATTFSGTLPPGNGGTGTNTVFTTGSVVFAGASGVYAQDNANFFWDATNHRLGIGTASPSQQLDIYNANNAIMNLNGGTGSGLGPQINFARGGTSQGWIGTASRIFGGTGNDLSLQSAGGIQFGVNSSGPNVVITSTGKVGINKTNPSGLLELYNPSASQNALKIVNDYSVNAVDINQAGDGIPINISADTSSGASISVNKATGNYLANLMTSGLNITGAYQHFGVNGLGRGMNIAVTNNESSDTGYTLYGANISATANTAGNTAVGLNVTAASSSGTAYPAIFSGGNVGIGTTAPSTIIGLGGAAARTIGMERGTVAATAGYALTLQSGGATSGSTNKAGGDLVLSSGTATGTGTSNITFKTHPAGSTGTTDTTATTAMTILGSGNVGIGTASPAYALDVNGTLQTSAARMFGWTGIADPWLGNAAAGSGGANVIRVAADQPQDGGDINFYSQAYASSPYPRMTFTSPGFGFYLTSGAWPAGAKNGAEALVIDSSGKVGIGTATPDASSLLDVYSTTKGFLPPRMTTVQVNAIASPTNGLLVYDNTADRYKAYQGGSWQEILTSASGNIPNNSLDFDKFKDAMTLDASTDILETGTNTLSITNTGTGNSFVVNDQASDTTPFVIDNAGNVGIGTATPQSKLEILGANNQAVGGEASLKGTLRLIDSGGIAGVSAGGIEFKAANSGNGYGFRVTNPDLGTGETPLYFQRRSDSASWTDALTILGTNGNVGIGTTTPSSILAFGGAAARTIWMERGTVADTAGFGLTLQSGGATSGATNKAGGNLVLSSGTSTGTATSAIQFNVASAGSTGTTDNSPAAILGLSLAGFSPRNATTDTAGRNAVIQAAGATSGATNKAGGDLILSSGTSTGTGASKIQFQTYAAGSTGTTDNSAATAMTILGSGNVGIGSATPGAKLDIMALPGGGGAGTDPTWNAHDAVIIQGDTAFSGLQFETGPTGQSYIGFSQGGASATRNRGLIVYDNASDYMSFGTSAGTERMRITSTGNVGIGTTNPSRTLDIKGSSNAGGDSLYVQNSDGTESFRVRGYGDASLAATLYFGGIGSASHFSGGHMGIYSNQATGSAFATFTHNDGTTALLIKSNSDILMQSAGGSVAIGTTTPGSKLHVYAGEAQVGTSGAACAAGNAGAVRYATGALYFCDSATWQALVTSGSGSVPFAFPPGTVTSPGLYVTGDSNTGFYQASADTLSVTAGGTEVMRWNTAASGVNYLSVTPAAAGAAPSIAAAGSDTNVSIALTPKGSGGVGIGTASPASIFHVYGSSNPIATIQDGSNAGATLNFVQPSRTLNLSMNAAGDFVLNDATAGLTRLYLTSSTGYMGIGNYGWSTYYPANSLDVSGAMSIGYGLSPTTAPSNGLIVNGNVGIGTTSPGAKLQVGSGGTGNLKVSGSSNGTVDLNYNGDTRAMLVENAYNTFGASYSPVNGNGGIKLGMTASAYSYIVGGTSLLLNPVSGNVGIGTTIVNAWHQNYKVAQLGANLNIAGGATLGADGDLITENAYYDGTWKYAATGAAGVYTQSAGYHDFRVAASGTAGSAITWTNGLRITNDGSVGIGTTTPGSILAIGGDAARTVGMDRGTVAATAGYALTLQSGGATSGSTNKAGGDLVLSSGTGTGTGTSNITFKTHPAGSTGSTDTTATTAMTILGSGNVGIGTTTPTSLLQIDATRGGTDPLILRETTQGANARFYFTTPLGTGPDLEVGGMERLLLNPSYALRLLTPYVEIPQAINWINSSYATTYQTHSFRLLSDTVDKTWLYAGYNSTTQIQGYNDGQYAVALQPNGGNVGIGTTSPNVTGYGAGNTVLTVSGTGNVGSALELQNTAADGDGVINGDINFMQSANSSKRIAIIRALTDGTTAGNRGGAITFLTQPDGVSGVNERMRITNAGNVGIGTTAPAASALLDVYSTTKGILPPRVTTTQRDAISSPATGLTVYNTTNAELESYNGVTYGWEAVGAGALDAAGTTGQVQFNSAGTLGADSAFFWDNTNKRLGIGTATPGASLHVKNNSDQIGLMLTPNSTQTNVLMRWNDSSGTQVGYLNAAGLIYTPAVETGTLGVKFDYKWLQYTAGGAPLYLRDQTNGRMQITYNAGTAGNASSVFLDKLVVQAGAGQAANLFEAQNSSGTALTVVDVSGNVGIGTTAPFTNLHVVGNEGIYSAGVTSGGSPIGASLYLGDANWIAGNYNSAPGLSAIYDSTTTVAGSLGLYSYTGGARYERMRILGNGLVGIGTATPAYTLDVNGTMQAAVSSGYARIGAASANTPAITLTGYFDNYNYGGAINIMNKNGSLTLPLLTLGSVSYPIAVWNSGGTIASYMDMTGLIYTTGQIQSTGTGTNYFSGNVGIGTTTPAASALLDVYSTTKGFLPPRVTTTQRDAIASPATGLTVYNSTTNALNVYSGSSWGAALSGASGSDGYVQFAAGGTLSSDSNFFWDNTNKRLGIGATSPGSKLQLGDNTTLSYTTLGQRSHALIGLAGMQAVGDRAQLLFGFGGGTYAGASFGTVVTNATNYFKQDFVWAQRDATTDTAPSEVMRLTSAGNVGIGTTAPAAALHVQSANQNGGVGNLILQDTNSQAAGTGAAITFRGVYTGSSATQGAEIRQVKTNSTDGNYSFGLAFSTRNSGSAMAEAVRIDNVGNVGIGTASPANLLTINQSSNAAADTPSTYGIALYNQGTLNANFGSDSSYVLLQSWASKPLKINNQGNDTLINPNAGNVGIGTTSPSKKLTVFDATAPTLKLDNGTYSATLTQGASYTTTLAADANLVLTTARGGQINFTNTSGSYYFTDPYGFSSPGDVTAGSANKLGFLSVGSTTPFGAIGANFTDNNTTALVFYSKASGTDTERMRITSAGNVGIGTTSPGYPLEIDSSTIGAPLQLVLKNTAASSGQEAQLWLYTPNNTGANDRSWAIGTNHSVHGSLEFFHSTANNTLPTSGTTAVTFDSSGNVGIGTTSPSSILAFGGDAARTVGMERGTVAATAGYALTLQAGGATSGSTNKAGGDLVLSSGTSTGTGTSNIYFKTFPAGGTGTSDNTAVTTMAVSGTGRVGIGTATPADLFHVYQSTNSFVSSYFENPSTGTGAVSRILLINSDGGGGGLSVEKYSTGYAGSGVRTASSSGIIESAGGGNGNLSIATGGTGAIKFYTNGLTPTEERMRITDTGLVGIGTTSPAASALLDVYSTTKGLLPPRVTTTQRDAISSPATGLTVYNTTTNLLNIYNGSAWVAANAGGTAAASGSDGYVQFAASSLLASDSAFFWDNTNKRLGIGTASPAYALDVNGSVNISSALNLSGDMYIYGGRTIKGWNNDLKLQTHGSYSIPIFTNDIQRMVIDASGNVGIGTATPAAALDVYGGSIYGNTIGFNQGTRTQLSSAADKYLRIANAAGTTYVDMHLLATGSFQWGQDTASAAAQTMGVANIAAGTADTAGSNWTLNGSRGTGTGAGGAIIFQTAPAGSTGSAQNALVEAMRITSDGNVGIGTASPDAPLRLVKDLGVASGVNSEATFSHTPSGAGNAGVDIGYWANGSSRLGGYIRSTGSLPFYIVRGDGTTRDFTLDTTGNVGIGTTSPVQKLEINGASQFDGDLFFTASGASLLRAEADANTFISISTGKTPLRVKGTASQAVDLFQVQNSTPSTLFNITAAGNVGIGTTAPGQTLDVVGNIRSVRGASSGNIYAGSGGQIFDPNDGTNAISISSSGGGIRLYDRVYLGSAYGGATPTVFASGSDLVLGQNVTANVTIKSGGNVGIGTTTPSSILAFSGNAAQTVGMERGTVAATAGYALTLQSGGATNGSTNKAGGDLVLSSGTATGTGTSNITFKTHPAGSTGTTDTTAATAMTILGSGYVGIGTATPQVALDVAGLANIGATTLRMEMYDSGSSSTDTYNMGLSPNTYRRFYWLSLEGANQQAMSFSDGSGSYNIFGISNSTDSGSTWNPRFVVQATGNVGIGSASPAYPLDVVGDIRTSQCLRYNNSTLGTCSSDKALKKDIAPFTAGLAEVAALKPVTYRYNGLGGNPDTGAVQIGLIAQDVEGVAPELVGSQQVLLHPTDPQKTTVKTVNYSAITYILVNAVRELNSLLAGLTAKVEKLAVSVEQLVAEVTAHTAEINELKAANANLAKEILLLKAANDNGNAHLHDRDAAANLKTMRDLKPANDNLREEIKPDKKAAHR